ncbi:MAG: cytochrome c biogenesis protein CcdA [Flavobacteriaceae bacterium]
MIKYLVALFAFFTISSSFSQIYEPTEWVSELIEVGENEYELEFKVFVDEGWYVYSQEIDADEGPLPTEFAYLNQEGNYELIGATLEPETEPKYDAVWDLVIKTMSDTVTFKQKVKVINPNLHAIDAEVMFMVCNDELCLPPEIVEFQFIINENASLAETATHQETSEVDTANIEEGEEKSEKRSLWTIFIVAFLFGFTALLTPCVFPMIPLTVSFFTKQSKSRAQGIKNAIFYGISIVVIYVFLGWLITFIFGADALNQLSTDVYFNLAFFLLLVVFAVSFFGAFEITLPTSWANKVDKQSGKGGFIGIFFMAMALAIVSFSCTGPIVGTLLVEAATSGGIAPIIGMLGFSLALAIPFMLFALFPGWLNSLPKSGGWLNSVKVVLGFLELALAFKFLSNADLVLQTHLLEREVFIAIWVAIFGALTLYLFKQIKLPHDEDSKTLSVGRLMFGLVTLTFTIYLIPGIWGAPLKIISGFPPPMTYSESPYGVGNTKGGGVSSFEDGMPEGAKPGPHDILTFIDYEKGLEYAKEVNKPILIDFTGHACVNCRKMEERVWAEPQILSVLKNEIVLISLYVDERKKLPESEQYTSPTTGKEIKTVGNKWSDFQIKNYKMNAQPYYVLINLEEETLNEPVGYMPDVEDYEGWLREGINAF